MCGRDLVRGRPGPWQHPRGRSPHTAIASQPPCHWGRGREGGRLSGRGGRVRVRVHKLVGVQGCQVHYKHTHLSCPVGTIATRTNPCVSGVGEDSVLSFQMRLTEGLEQYTSHC